MNPTNTGSFGAATGGISPELQAAITNRARSGGATAQVTGTSQNINAQNQPAQPVTGSAPAIQPQQTSQIQPQNLPFDPGEAKIILNSLGGRLKALSKLQGA